MQVQYSSRYLNGLADSPNLGEGLRVKNPDPGNYHAFMIHKDDIVEFVRRYRDYEAEQKSFLVPNKMKRVFIIHGWRLIRRAIGFLG